MKNQNSIKNLLSAVLMLLLIQNSYSQENYLKGYIIQLKGDTLHGFIDYRNWDKNPDKIFFKEQLNANPTRYTPIDIKEFGALDEIYKSAVVQTEISTDNIKNLEYDNIGLKIVIDTTFLQTMVQGPKCLYYYKTKMGKSQFYIRNDSAFELLIYKKYLKLDNGLYSTAENKKYIGQLSYYFRDCPDVRAKFKNVTYEKESLEKLFNFYYACTHAETKFQKKTSKMTVETGALAGISVTTISFSGGGLKYMVDASFEPSVSFSAGLFLDIVLPRNQGKWSICNELNYTSYKVNGRYDEYESADNYRVTYTKLGYSYLKMKNMLRYKYPIGNKFIYMNVGPSIGVVVGETNYKRVESKFYSEERIQEGVAFEDTRKYEFGFDIGIGIKYKKYSMEIRYERGNGMSDIMQLVSRTNNLFFLLGYRFK